MVLRKGDRLHYSVGFHGLFRGVDYRLLTAGFVGRRPMGKVPTADYALPTEAYPQGRPYTIEVSRQMNV